MKDILDQVGLFDELVEVLKSDVKKRFINDNTGNCGVITDIDDTYLEYNGYVIVTFTDSYNNHYFHNVYNYDYISRHNHRYHIGKNAIIEFDIPAKNNDVKSENNAISPAHYKQGDVECIDAIIAATVNKHGSEAFCVGNILKYLWRYESKNGIEDVRKAKWYLNKLEELLVE